MTQQSRDNTAGTNTKKPEMTDTEKVMLYLKKNPDVLKKFVLAHPDVVTSLRFPTESDNGTTDFYAFRAHKLQKELEHLKTRNRLLIQTSTDNMESQQQIHQLALDILAAGSIKELLKTLRGYLNDQMDVDYTHLCVLEDAPLPRNIHNSHQTVTRDTFEQIFADSTEPVVLRTLYEDEDKAIHGDWAESAASDGLLRLQTPQGDDIGFLALVSGQRDRFHPGQGAELLTFIARIIGHVMESWVTETAAGKAQQKTG